MQRKYFLLLIRFVFYVFGIGALLYYIYQAPYNPHPHTVEDIRKWVNSFGALAPLMYIIIYTIRPLLLFPTLILNLSAGVLFGPYFGVLLVLIGGLGCAIFCYILGRFGGGRWLLENFGGAWGKKLNCYLVNPNSFVTMLWLRTVPIFPYDPVSVVAGSVMFPINSYIFATLLGMLPGAIAYNFLADSFGTSRFYLAIIVTIIAFGIPFWLWKRTGKNRGLQDFNIMEENNEE